jgi:hypothetical protein
VQRYDGNTNQLGGFWRAVGFRHGDRDIEDVSTFYALILACGSISRTVTGERLAFAEAMMLAHMMAALLTG